MAMYLGSNKVEMGQISSSGGSSDFSTAEVTIIATPYSSFGLYEPQNDNFPYGYKGIFFNNEQQQFVSNSPYTEVNESTTYTLYYLGDSYECYPSNHYESSTGDVTYNSNTGVLTITGDCTITGSILD